MNTYYFIQRYKTDNAISGVLKRKLEKTKDEVLAAILIQNSYSNFSQNIELIEDESKIDLIEYALKQESNAELEDILDALNDIEFSIINFINGKK